MDLSFLRDLPWAVILPAVAGGGMVYVWWTDKRKPRRERVLTAVFGILAVAGGVVAFFDQQEATKQEQRQALKLQASQAELKANQLKLNASQAKLQASQTQLQASQAALQARADHIANLNEDIKGLVTGGDSYGFLRFRTVRPRYSPGQWAPRIEIAFVGKYPLHDAKVEVYDHDFLASPPDNLRPEEIQRKARLESQSLGVIAKDAAKVFFADKFPFPDQRGRYEIFLSARNGVAYQQLLIEKVNAENIGEVYQYAWRVFRLDGLRRTELLQSHSDRHFPKGAIAWW